MQAIIISIQQEILNKDSDYLPFVLYNFATIIILYQKLSEIK